MAEYIDRGKLMQFPIRREHCDKDHANEHFLNGIETVMEYVENLPAADVAPVVHGQWIDNFIPDSMLCGCSVCGFTCGAYSFLYCPMCGAKMDKPGGDSNAAVSNV